jgi:hypothetical protein
MSLDAMLANLGGVGWAGLEEHFSPAKVADAFDPGADLKKVLFALYHTVDGRKIVEWWFDLTFRAPYPHVGSSLEAAAIAAAKHEARAAVGLALLKAIADGEKLLHPKEPAT